MGNNEESVLEGQAESNLPVFIQRMIRVFKRNSQRVSKDCCRFLKCDIVLSDVCGSLYCLGLTVLLGQS